jgi:aspartate racemase
MNKKKIGIVGGMGSRAGVLFLEKIINYSPAQKDQDFPEIIFHNNSAVPDRTRAIVYNEPSPVGDICRSIDIFNANGVDLIALACITSYYYYDDFWPRTTAEVLNPLCIIANAIKNDYTGIKRVGLLATTGTITTGLFHKVLHGCDVEIITLDAEDQEQCFMHSVYMKNGFKSAFVSDEAKSLMADCIKKISKKGVDAIVGGCTEVSLGVNAGSTALPYIDALDMLALETVGRCYNTEKNKDTWYGKKSIT